ncbi:MAG: cell wall-binding repeat-containing protein [Acidimicrobiales bacterium]
MWRVLGMLPRRHGRVFTAAASGAAVIGLAIGSTAAYAPAQANAPTRLYGIDRFATAAAVSAATFPSGASVVYVATGQDFADALTAAAAAGGTSPVLLVTQSLLPSSTATELRRLRPSRVVAMGGTSSIGDSVLVSIRNVVASATVSRVSGWRRYETAATLSRTAFTSGASLVFVATGLDYPDALTAAAAAGGKSPVLLTLPDALPSATADELHRLSPRTIRVMGGTSAVGATVVSALQTAAPDASVQRVSGPDRFSTAAALSRALYPGGALGAFVATGFDFPDALSAAVAASGHGPVLLVADPPYASPAIAELQRLGAQTLTVVGGVAAVGDDLVSRLAAALAQPPPVSEKASLVVSTARAQLGKPYQWGGAGPDVFDCSGLVMFSWAAAGVKLPHNAEAQADLVAPIAIASLQPGDIVFYGTPGNVYHDGLYIGDGQMIEAPHSGVPVHIADIDRPDLLIGGRPR